MSERDELAAIIMSPESFDGGPVSCGPNDIYAARIADAILAAGYRKHRTVTTVEELDALPVGSVVMDSDGDPWKKMATDLWRAQNSLYAEESSTVFWTDSTIHPTILHEGEA